MIPPPPLLPSGVCTSRVSKGSGLSSPLDVFETSVVLFVVEHSKKDTNTMGNSLGPLWQAYGRFQRDDTRVTRRSSDDEAKGEAKAGDDTREEDCGAPRMKRRRTERVDSGDEEVQPPAPSPAIPSWVHRSAARLGCRDVLAQAATPYGADYALYPGAAKETHSKYLLHADLLPKEPADSQHVHTDGSLPKRLIASARVANSVRKRAVWAIPSSPGIEVGDTTSVVAVDLVELQWTDSLK